MSGPLDNISTKVLALILGLLLWFHVATDKVYHHRVTLPVSEITLDKDLALSQAPPDSVSVSVSASGKQLIQQSWQKEGIRINATGLPAGRHQLNLTTGNSFLVGATDLVTLESVVSPASIELRIDRQSNRSLPVTTDIETVPDEGFAVKQVSTPEPSEVLVYGPRSLLRSFNTVVTEHRELTGLRNDISLKLALRQPIGYGVRLEPDSVEINIQVVPVRTRVVEDVPIVVFNRPEGIALSLEPSEVDVTITGPPTVVDSLDPATIVASTDFLNLAADSTAQIKVDGPAQIRIKSQSTQSVEIRLP